LSLESELLELVQNLYEAATEPGLWADFLKRYTELVSAEFTVLQVHDLRGHKSTVVEAFGLSAPFTRSYNEHYSKLNIWRDRGCHLYIAGRVNLDHEYCPRAVFERSEFYNDYMRHIGGRYSMAAVIARDDGYAPTLSAMRAGRPFGRDESDVPRFLLPHLRRAWEVSHRLELLSAGEALLDTLPTGVLFLAVTGKAIYWNKAADEIFRANDGLTLRNGTLVTFDRKAGIQLRKAIEDAISPGSVCDPTVITIPRPSLCREYGVLAVPFLGRFRQFAGMPGPVAVVIISEPERQQPAIAQVLIQMYMLTRKEAELAIKLLEAKSLEQAADELGVAYETARTHLRRIFSKTGTSRQTELVLLMARLPSLSVRIKQTGRARG